MLKWIGMAGTSINRTWHISMLSFFGDVEIRMYDQKRLLIVPGTS